MVESPGQKSPLRRPAPQRNPRPPREENLQRPRHPETVKPAQTPSCAAAAAFVSKRKDCRGLFESHQEVFKMKQRRFIICGCICAGLLVLPYVTVLVNRPYGFWGIFGYYTFYAGAVGLGGWVLLVIFRPKPSCVNCEKDLEKNWTHFCSECGSDQVIPPNPANEKPWPQCGACGKEAARGLKSSRLYKTCFCPHCGVHLSSAGM